VSLILDIIGIPVKVEENEKKTILRLFSHLTSLLPIGNTNSKGFRVPNSEIDSELYLKYLFAI
jgi:hypothetical protein